MTRLLLTFAFDARSPWDRSAEWRAAEKLRAESGSSSIRISKATSAALGDLANRVRAAIPDSEKSRYHDRITADALLAALCSGEVVFPLPPAPAADPRQLDALADLEAAHASGDRKTHARKDPRVHAKAGSRPTHAKGSTRMQKSRPRKVHAKPDVGKRMQKTKNGRRGSARPKIAKRGKGK